MSTLKVDAIRHNSATSDAITTAADGTCTAKLTSIGGGGLSHRNLIINGAMNVAQRASSSTSSGYATVDRFKYTYSGTDSAPTQAQVDVASGTTPYTLGFRKAYKITNANQSSGAGAGDHIRLEVNLEAQDIANSGWNYLSSSSFITLSFWCKSSVAQNFYACIRTPDGSSQNYSFETGSLTADTWTKVTKTIPGNSNLTFDDNVELGWNMEIAMFMGTDDTDSGNTMNQWAAYNSSNQMPDNTSTWYTTNGATWEITGMQLEVGDTATSFEHRSFGEELERCKRYYQTLPSGLISVRMAQDTTYSNAGMQTTFILPTPMRTNPALSNWNDGSGTITHTFYDGNYSNASNKELNMYGGIHNGTVQYRFNYSQANNGGSSLGTNFKFGISQDPIAFNAEL